ncbi:hypothetical protein LEP1GSC176_1111, partial [Leptospira kirschneri str. MMD1493]
FYAKTGWTMILFVFYSSSHKFQSLTVNSRFVRVPTD